MASGSTTFTIMSSGFASCAAIPAASTCEAKPFPQGTSPALSWTAGPTGTMSYAIVFKDLSVLARTAATDPNYNRGYHYVMWDIPANVTSLPAAVAGGFAVPGVSGALQWSNFNNYGFFGPCPNFDPAMPTDFNDVYCFQIYALPFAKAPVPAAMMGTSTVRLLDNVFKPAALAVAEYRGTSNAHSVGSRRASASDGSAAAARGRPAGPAEQAEALVVQPAVPVARPAEPLVRPAEPLARPAEQLARPAGPLVQPAEQPVRPAEQRCSG